MAHRVTGTKTGLCILVYILYYVNAATSLKFISGCPESVCRASGKREVFILNVKIREWDKIRKLGLESHSQIFEETRIIQEPDQFTGI